MFEHPKKVCMTYSEHLMFSLELSSIFFIGSVKAFIHAFYPDILGNASTEINNLITQKIRSSSCNKETQTELTTKGLMSSFWKTS